MYDYFFDNCMVKRKTIQARQYFEYLFINCEYFHHVICANFDKVNRKKTLNYQWIFAIISCVKP